MIVIATGQSLSRVLRSTRNHCLPLSNPQGRSSVANVGMEL
jgi:hypothetical protein